MVATSASRFFPGFVGVPGQRTFFLQAEAEGSAAWYLLEKGQVAGLAASAHELLREMGFTGEGADLEPGEIDDPVSVAFRVAEIHLIYKEPTGLIEVTLIPTTEDASAAVYTLTPDQLAAAAHIGERAVAGGRPPCPECGLALDPEGHVCPTTNGDLRNHRP